MEYAYSIVMFCLAGGIFIYAVLLAVCKNTNLIMRSYAVKMKDRRRYAVQFAKIMALIGVAPLISGLIGLTGMRWLAAGVLLITFTIFMRIGIKIMEKEML